MYQHAKYTDLENALQQIKKILRKQNYKEICKASLKIYIYISDNLEIPNIRRKESRSVFQHTRLLQNL